jgi:antitoxin component YwqK of YwqJK toxin-antitoxin module
LVEQAHRAYLENEKLIKRAREQNEFGSDLYERLGDLTALDDQYYELNEQSYSNFEKYAREHPQEFCVDENGKPFDNSFSGKCTTRHPDGSMKEEFELVNGAIHGEFKTYYTSGQLSSVNSYVSGEQVGKQSAWYESGVLKRVVVIDPMTKARINETYHPNGQLAEREERDAYDERKGEHKEWYPNGTLKEQGTYTSNNARNGPWLEYWEDGSKKVEAEFKEGEFLVHNCWDAAGKQLLTNGTGMYINEFKMDMPTRKITYRYETAYRNYRRHGLSNSYSDGVLSLSQEFQDGVQHGYARSYDGNGALKEERLYKNGELISTNVVKRK